MTSARTAAQFGVTPRVAMLSYSTGTSGSGPDVDVVVEATRLAREKAPELAIEGPIQFDAAVDEAVAATKLPGSEVAGKATVFVFPSLEAGTSATRRSSVPPARSPSAPSCRASTSPSTTCRAAPSSKTSSTPSP